MESALMALDGGIIEPLLRHTPLVGRGANSRDRDLVISAAVVAVHQLTWTGMHLFEAHKAVAGILHKAGFKKSRHNPHIEPRTGRGWCEKIAEDVGRHTERARFVGDMLRDKDRVAFSSMPRPDAR